MTAEPATKKILIRVEPELHRQLKIMAAETGQPMNQLVEDAIRRIVEKHNRRKGA